MKNMATRIVNPDIFRYQVAKFLPFEDEDTPYGILYINFIMVGGRIYGPRGMSGPFELKITNDAGHGLAKNAMPMGLNDLIVEQPNPTTGVFTALLTAWKGAGTKNARNLAVEALLVSHGILTADLAGT